MSSKFHAKTTRDKIAPRKGNNNTPDYLQIYIKNVLLLYFFFRTFSQFQFNNIQIRRKNTMARDEKQNNIQKIMNQKIPLQPKTSSINTFKPKTNHKQPKQTEHSYKTNSNQINQNIYTELPKHSHRTSTIQPNVYYSQKPCLSPLQTQLLHSNHPTKEPSLTKQEFKTSIIQMITTVKYLLFEITKEEIQEQQEEEYKEEQKKKQKNDKKQEKENKSKHNAE